MTRFLFTDGQENALIILLRGEEIAFFAVLSRPHECGVAQQLIPLFLAWCAPATAPIGRGRVVVVLQGNQVVGVAVVAVFGLIAVFCQVDFK